MTDRVRTAAAAVVVVLLGALLAPAAAAAAAPTVDPADATSGPDVVCRFDDPRLDEISGMAWSLRHPGVLWLLEDSGGGPYLYAVDAADCRTLARVRLSGATARDYESIATGPDRAGRPTIWVGDTGDNRSSWPDVRVIAVPEPAALRDGADLASTVHRVTYPDRPHDAETLLADPRGPRLWVVSKELFSGALWSLPGLQAERRVTARRLADVGGLVTDGSVSGDGSRTVLRDYVSAYVYTGLPSAASFATAPVRVPLPRQAQGEAVAWAADGTALLVASERDDRLLRVALPSTAWTATARGAAHPEPSATGDPSAAAVPPAPPPGASAGAGRTALAAGLVVAALAVFLVAARRLRR